MANQIGKIEIDFEVVDTGNPETLIVHDFSRWKVIENMPAYIEITVPGARKPVILPFKKYATNGFNTLTLGLTSHEDCKENLKPLPDGIYSICIRGGAEGTYSKQKYFLKKDRLQLQLDTVWIKLGLDYDHRDINYITSLQYIEGFLSAASSAARLGKAAKASDFFSMAQADMEKYLDCKNCL